MFSFWFVNDEDACYDMCQGTGGKGLKLCAHMYLCLQDAVDGRMGRGKHPITLWLLAKVEVESKYAFVRSQSFSVAAFFLT